MPKKELISLVAQKTGITKKDVTLVIDTMLDSVIDSVVTGEDVKLVGFGTFTTVERAAREGRNPQTGESITIEARKAPKFKPSKALRDAVK